MKPVNVLQALYLTAFAVAGPIPGSQHLVAREVPQEHSHEQFLTTVRAALNLNNPAGIVDPVFGLLGDAVQYTVTKQDFYLADMQRRRQQEGKGQSPMSNASSKRLPTRLSPTRRPLVMSTVKLQL
jgi:hypothetical protein